MVSCPVPVRACRTLAGVAKRVISVEKRVNRPQREAPPPGAGCDVVHVSILVCNAVSGRGEARFEADEVNLDNAPMSPDGWEPEAGQGLHEEEDRCV